MGHSPHHRGRAFSCYSLAKFDCSGKRNVWLGLEQVIVEVVLLKMRASQQGIFKFLVINILLSLALKLIGNLHGDS